MGMEIPTEFIVRLANGNASDDIELLLNMCGVENAGGVIGEKIVRCKDCEWLTKDEDGDEWCRYLKRHVAKDDFCAWGERRELEAVEVWNQWSADDVTCSEES